MGEYRTVYSNFANFETFRSFWKLYAQIVEESV